MLNNVSVKRAPENETVIQRIVNGRIIRTFYLRIDGEWLRYRRVFIGYVH